MSQKAADFLEEAVQQEWPIQVILTTLLVMVTSITVFMLTSPSHYSPYNPDLLMEKTEDGEEKPVDWRDEYGRFWVQQKGVRYLKPDTSVVVVVLGDIGRSPRMQNHAISMAKHMGRVDIVGYQESDVHPYITKDPMIQIVPLSRTPGFLNTRNRLLFLLFGPLKVLWQVMTLYRALGYRTKAARWMVLQIPPSIPTLLICLFIGFIRNTTLILDWHNIPHTLLSLRLSPSHILVKLLSLHDRLLARNASGHLAVSDAMSSLLQRSYGIPSDQLKVLHDRPTSSFRPLDASSRADFIRKCEFTNPHSTQLLNKKWRLLVSSTSWTPDEDFGILLDALVSYSADPNPNLPGILAIITGKGPLKQSYLARIAELNQQKKLERVVIHTAFLPAEDYAKLLASADLGVSLHMSSSGVDLPMKVVDMFGAGLPVVGWSQYEAWPELVKEGVNGRGFESEERLAELLKSLFGNDSELATLKEGAMKESERGWEPEWESTLGLRLRLVKPAKPDS